MPNYKIMSIFLLFVFILSSIAVPQDVRRTRQVEFPAGGIDFSTGVTDPVTGQKCVTKSEETESVAADPILTCVHKKVEKCYYTYITQFSPVQEQVCNHNYQKTCRISFNKKAVNETVRKCYKPVEKVCDGRGHEECHTVYESSCSTKYVEKIPGKYVGKTDCQKLPIAMCGAGCDYEEGTEECHEKVITTVVEVPEEVCDLSPHKICKFVTKLVPRLKPSQKCTIIPQETCSYKFSAPRQVKKPILTKWCLEDSQLMQRHSNHTASPKPLINASVSDPFKTSSPSDSRFSPQLADAESKVSDEDSSDDEIGIEVEQVRTSIEKDFPATRLNILHPEFVKPSKIIFVDNTQSVDDIIDDEDIVNPFDDLKSLITSGNLSEEENEDLDNFNLGIHLEHFRASIGNSFQTQDFADFVDFEHF